MVLLVLLLAFGTLALWAANRSLARRIEWIERRLNEVEQARPRATGDAEGAATAGVPPAPSPLPVAMGAAGIAPSLSEDIESVAPSPGGMPNEPKDTGYSLPPEPERERGREPEPEPERERETFGVLFERLVAGRLLIWLGGITLVVAAIFLIRYSIEIGLITPAARMIGAAIFGLVLIGAGEYARRGRFLAEDPRVAQALVGAGIAVLYATAYGSHILYGLIGAGAATATMAAITAAALGLSLRHGQPTAVIGLIGGFATPILVGDPKANLLSLLLYLGLLDLALFLVAWRRGWAWLAAAAAMLSLVWSGGLLGRDPADALLAGGFAALAALAAVIVRPGGGTPWRFGWPVAIALLQLAVLIGRADIGWPAWALFGALGAASMALAALHRDHRFAPVLALTLALLVLFVKVALEDRIAPSAAIGVGLLFGGGGLALGLWRPRTLWSGLCAAGLAGPVLIVRAGAPATLDARGWAAIAAAAALGQALLIWRNRARASLATADLALLIGAGAAALLGGAAVWDLVAADLVAAGWLMIALAIAVAARRLSDAALSAAALAAAAAAAIRALAMVPELVTTTTTAAFEGAPALATGLPDMRAALVSLAVPAFLIAALRWILPPIRERRAVLPVASAFAVAAAYVWFKQMFGLADAADFAARGFFERTILTQMLFLAGWLFATGRVRWRGAPPAAARWTGAVLTALAAARLIWFDLLLHDPLWSEQHVGALPALNLVTAEFLGAAAWLYLARRRAAAGPRAAGWLGAFLVALVAGAGLNVRQLFHGTSLAGPDVPIAESYGYSLAGLIVSIGLILAGMRLPDKALRLAGLLALTATVLKVFLIDAAQLTGILRILSFLGLGVALIGIGRLYGPLLRAEKGKAALP